MPVIITDQEGNKVFGGTVNPDGDGDCFFHCLQITRKEAKEKLLVVADQKPYRELVAPEIFSLYMQDLVIGEGCRFPIPFIAFQDELFMSRYHEMAYEQSAYQQQVKFTNSFSSTFLVSRMDDSKFKSAKQSFIEVLKEKYSAFLENVKKKMPVVSDQQLLQDFIQATEIPYNLPASLHRLFHKEAFTQWFIDYPETEKTIVAGLNKLYKEELNNKSLSCDELMHSPVVRDDHKRQLQTLLETWDEKAQKLLEFMSSEQVYKLFIKDYVGDLERKPWIGFLQSSNTERLNNIRKTSAMDAIAHLENVDFKIWKKQTVKVDKKRSLEESSSDLSAIKLTSDIVQYDQLELIHHCQVKEAEETIHLELEHLIHFKLIVPFANCLQPRQCPKTVNILREMTDEFHKEILETLPGENELEGYSYVLHKAIMLGGSGLESALMILRLLCDSNDPEIEGSVDINHEDQGLSPLELAEIRHGVNRFNSWNMLAEFLKQWGAHPTNVEALARNESVEESTTAKFKL